MKVLLLILAVASIESATTRPVEPSVSSQLEQLEPPGPLGFALWRITVPDVPPAGDIHTTVEPICEAWIYDAEPKVIAKLHRGDAFPKPFDSWRFVGIPENRKGPSILITNVDTKETVVLELARKRPSTRPVTIH